MKHNNKKIVITGAAGNIGNELSFLLTYALPLYNYNFDLWLYEKEYNLGLCNDLREELYLCKSPYIDSIYCESDSDRAFSGADCIFFAGAHCCIKHPIDIQELLFRNWRSFEAQSQSLNRVCSDNTICLVIANPCNTNAYILMKNAPRLPKKNFHAMSQLDLNRVKNYIYFKKGNMCLDTDAIVWGNHSSTVVPEYNLFHTISDYTPFLEFVQTRGAEVTKNKNGKTSCSSAAFAALEAMRNILTPHTRFCSGVHTEGNLIGIDEDLIFSQPCISLGNGDYRVLKEIKPASFLRPWIIETERELIEEKSRYLSKFAVETSL
jgi:malate/lactate dehydrogenase